MQDRHQNREQYFAELANTSRDFYIPYINQFRDIRQGMKVLEIGCGEGGNLLPFAELGCTVKGVDLAPTRIKQATAFFSTHGYDPVFVNANIFDLHAEDEKDKYQLILIHDVIEHIYDKDRFFAHLKQFLAEDGMVFWGFPAWQMPFGGHQQICRSKVCSKLPFIHLLPKSFYRSLLVRAGEHQACIDELLDIKRCATSIEKFERLVKSHNYTVLNRCLWFINPHYKHKFKLKPRKLLFPLTRMAYIRNYFTTSCFYITTCGSK